MLCFDVGMSGVGSGTTITQLEAPSEILLDQAVATARQIQKKMKDLCPFVGFDLILVHTGHWTAIMTSISVMQHLVHTCHHWSYNLYLDTHVNLCHRKDLMVLGLILAE